MASPSSSRRDAAKRTALRAAVVAVLVVVGAALLSGCVTVRPEDKEFLANRPMTFGSEGMVGAHDQHVFGNREGSYGAGGVTGGGCGCN